MDDAFRQYVESMHGSFERLTGMEPVTIATIPKNAQSECIYLFSEGARHLYVGRTRHLRQPERQHCEQQFVLPRVRIRWPSQSIASPLDKLFQWCGSPKRICPSPYRFRAVPSRSTARSYNKRGDPAFAPIEDHAARSSRTPHSHRRLLLSEAADDLGVRCNR